MPMRGEMNSPESLGRMLAQARLLKGMTQRDLAEELGISQRYIWEMESAKPSLFTNRLFATMRATGMKLIAEIEPPAADNG